MPTSKTTLPTSKIPAKWLAIIVFVLVAYGLCQPFVNRKLGWNWPSLASVMGPEEKKAKPESAADKDDKSTAATTGKSTKAGKRSETSDPDQSAQEIEQQLLGNDENESSSNSSTKPPKSSKPDSQESKLLYGFLKDLGREDYQSPAGLHYTRGSEQGHRLKHIERHLEDIPDRDGRHGVFDGDMPQVVRWIDDAYQRAKQGGKGTSREQGEMERTIYEAAFNKPIGYIGGREGKKQNHPPAKRLRLVVDDKDRVITAFPF